MIDKGKEKANDNENQRPTYISTADTVSNGNENFIRHEVIGDGNCGYTAFGITREDALKAIMQNLKQVQDLLRQAIEEQLLTETFIDYLSANKLLSANLQQAFNTYQKTAVNQKNAVNAADAKLRNFANDLAIIQAYVNYDIRDKKIDFGWSHPCILQALAQIRGIDLYIWQMEGGHLVPHQQYPRYTPKNIQSPQRTDILFINGNHFERLELSNLPQNNSHSSIGSDTKKEVLNNINNNSKSIRLDIIMTKVEEIIRYANEYATGKDLVLVLGNTGSGKSTFINYLAGQTMHEVTKEEFLEPVIETDNPIMAVGHNSFKSLTDHPQLYSDSSTGLTYCDCPGFLDSRGPEFDIPNAFAIKTIVEKAHAVKAVIVLVDYNSILAEKGRGLRETITILRQLFGIQDSNIAHYRDSIAILVSKSQQAYPPLTLDNFKTSFSEFDLLLNALKEQISFYDPLDRADMINRGACSRVQIIKLLKESPGMENTQQLFGFALGAESIAKLSQFVVALEENVRLHFEGKKFREANRLLQSLDRLQILNYSFVGDAYIRLCRMVRDLIRSLEGKDDSKAVLEKIREEMPLFKKEINESINVIVLRIQTREMHERQIKEAKAAENKASLEKDKALEALHDTEAKLRELKKATEEAVSKADAERLRAEQIQREILQLKLKEQSNCESHGGGKHPRRRCTIQ
jgi:energy-coupling factor transporter ATP-binding protein EcfA2